MTKNYCPQCTLHSPVFPEYGMCPNCGRDWDLPTLDELKQAYARIPEMVTGEPIDWEAIFDSFRSTVYLASVVIALERRRVEQRDPSDDPH